MVGRAKSVDSSSLTGRQGRVLRFLRSYVRSNGYPPTFREIGEELGITLNGVTYHLRRLEAKGAIRRVPGIARAIRLT